MPYRGLAVHHARRSVQRVEGMVLRGLTTVQRPAEVVDFALLPTHYYSYIPYHVCSYKPTQSVREP